MNVRPATDADIPAITAILEANDEPVSWPDVPRPPYVVHLLTRPATRVVVGELDGSVAGVAASIEVGSAERRFLSDLYVEPDAPVARTGPRHARRGARGGVGAHDVLVERPTCAGRVHPERDATVVAAALPRDRAGHAR
jgi:hypothetical protein